MAHWSPASAGRRRCRAGPCRQPAGLSSFPMTFALSHSRIVAEAPQTGGFETNNVTYRLTPLHRWRLSNGLRTRQLGINERCSLCPYPRIILDFDVRLGKDPGVPGKVIAIDGMVFIGHVKVADNIGAFRIHCNNF